MFDIAIDSNGYIYLANIAVDRVCRYTSAGMPAGPVFGSDLEALRAITVAGFTPTPVGENVLVEPWENVEVTFQGITEAGFTTAVVETSSSRVSPGAGNYLPVCSTPRFARRRVHLHLIGDRCRVRGRHAGGRPAGGLSSLLR